MAADLSLRIGSFAKDAGQFGFKLLCSIIFPLLLCFFVGVPTITEAALRVLITDIPDGVPAIWRLDLVETLKSLGARVVYIDQCWYGAGSKILKSNCSWLWRL